jgi:hypothetical protein
VVVTHEHAQVSGGRESVLDPRVVLATDLALVDVRLGRVHRHQSEIGTTRAQAQPHVPGAEDPLELQIPDMARVVIAGNQHESFTRKRGQPLPSQLVLVRVALVGHVTGDYDEIRPRSVDLLDSRAQQRVLMAGAANVEIGQLRDQHRTQSRRRGDAIPAAAAAADLLATDDAGSLPSRTTSPAALSSRSPRKRGRRSRPSRVHSLKPTCATSRGSTNVALRSRTSSANGDVARRRAPHHRGCGGGHADRIRERERRRSSALRARSGSSFTSSPATRRMSKT